MATKKPTKKTAARKVAKKTAPKPAAPTTTPAPATPKEARAFASKVDVPDPTPDQAAARARAVVCATRNSRTAIELRREANEVVFLPMVEQTDKGLLPFDVRRLSVVAFDAQYKPILDYPVGRAAVLFVGYATSYGGTSAAMTELANLVHVTDKELMMATQRATTAATGAAKGKPTAKATKPGAPKAPKAPKAPGVKKERAPSSASRFKELIMAGKLTDEAIFETVKKEFKLDDKKRTYVAWYRNWLKKHGQTPPAAKITKAA